VPDHSTSADCCAAILRTTLWEVESESVRYRQYIYDTPMWTRKVPFYTMRFPARYSELPEVDTRCERKNPTPNVANAKDAILLSYHSVLADL
jgi:hypothetical protein